MERAQRRPPARRARAAASSAGKRWRRRRPTEDGERSGHGHQQSKFSRVETHAVGADRSPRALDLGPLGRVLDQHRVGVVDVGVDPLRRRQRGQTLQTAARPRDRQMIHLPRGAVADAERGSARRRSRRCRRTAPGRSGQPSRAAHHPGRRSRARRRTIRRWLRRACSSPTVWPGCSPRGEARRTGRAPRKAVDARTRWAAVAVARAARLVRAPASVTSHLGERLGDREQSRVVLQNLGTARWRRAGGPGLPQQHDAQRVVQLGVGQDHALDRARGGSRGGRTGETGQAGRGRRARR